ncbi:MAG: FlgD immunoglobulin-like domain containing protein [Candidatus Zixiibacteriota bacterium]
MTLFVFFSGIVVSADLSPPTLLTAISDQDGEVPLFWFTPHPDTVDIAYHAGTMSTRFYVSATWHENCVGVRMSSPSVPFYLSRSKVYISHQGASIDTSYDFRAPFFVTVNQDSGGLPRNVFLDSVSTSANGPDSLSPGEWVETDHSLLMEDSLFWIVFHWLEGSPLSPLVGVDDLLNMGSSLWGMKTFFHFEWHPTYYNAMIEAEIAINPDTPSGVDTFRVYRSDNPDSMIYQSNLIASVPGEQFQYSDSEVVEEQSYFYCVTCFNSGWQSRASDTAQATPRRRAVLETDREEFSVCTSAGEPLSDYLTLTNAGGLPLEFRVRMDVEEEEWMGGSDAFGYTWTDDSLEENFQFCWIDIETTGVRIGESGDDNEEYGFFDLGFSFPFYGETFDSVRITSDGWLSFSDVYPCPTDTFQWFINRPLPWLWGPYSLVAPFWDDLKLVDSSAIYFCSHSDSAIISYVNMHHYGHASRGPYTFQTILTSDGEIILLYLHSDDSDTTATIGIQNYDGTTGLGVSCDEEYLHDSLAIKIRPGWVRVDSLEGCIQPGESKTLNLTFDPLSYPQGVYHADLLIESWDKNHQLETKIIPLTFCIDTTTSVEWADAGKPERIVLLKNYPNPFNAVTSIQYTVHGRQTPVRTTLKLYNLLGQKVRTLVNAEKTPGDYQVTWDGKDDRGREVASGVYLCILKTGSCQKIRKMLLLK